MESRRAEFLFQRYVQQQCNAAEEAELMAFLKEGGPQVEELLNRYINDREADKVLNEGVASGILEAVFQSGEREPAAVVPLKQKKQFRKQWLAAAVLVPLLGAGIWYWSASHTQTTAYNSGVILQPGEKAVLVLEDGSEVELDGKKNGNVDGTNGAVKLKNGVIAYGDSKALSGFNTLRTPKGGKFQVMLPDGTHVWLNAASAIRYPVSFDGGSRTVEMEGEAYFDVAANAGKPFVVKANGITVDVLGTGFNIMAYKEEGPVVTTLEQGSVRVNDGKSAMMLKPGLQAFKEEGKPQFTLQEADMDMTLAWKESKFGFRDADIYTLMRQTERWYNVEVSYEGQPVKDRFSGKLRKENSLRELLEVLEATGFVSFELKGNQLIVKNARTK